MIKAIIMDIDGVIVGSKHGVNFPLPTEKVIKKLKEVSSSGIPIVFCTAKFQSGIQELVKKAALHNPQITDGGALIIDPLGNKVIKKHIFEKALVQDIMKKYLENNIYVEAFSGEDYYIQKNQICEITEQHTAILQQGPKIVEDLQKHLEAIDVIKIIAFSKIDEEKSQIDLLVEDIADNIHTVWTMHPTMLPARLFIITINGVSKKAASLEVLNYLKISSEEALAIGDTLGDWNFMSLCKYVGVVENEDQELKDLAKSKGEGNYFFASSVDEDGFLDIINYFIKTDS